MTLERFHESKALTLGVELELQLVNTHSFDLAPYAEDMLALVQREHHRHGAQRMADDRGRFAAAAADLEHVARGLQQGGRLRGHRTALAGEGDDGVPVRRQSAHPAGHRLTARRVKRR